MNLITIIWIWLCILFCGIELFAKNKISYFIYIILVASWTSSNLIITPSIIYEYFGKNYGIIANGYLTFAISITWFWMYIFQNYLIKNIGITFSNLIISCSVIIFIFYSKKIKIGSKNKFLD